MENKIFCPRCRSLDVKKEITASMAVGVPQNWICNNCRYTNIVFPELKKMKTNRKNEIKDSLSKVRVK